MKNLGQVTENLDIARKQDIPTNTNQLTNGAGFITNSALSGYVPTSRKVNGKALSGNISLTASEVGALPTTTTYAGSASVGGPATSANKVNSALTITNGSTSITYDGSSAKSITIQAGGSGGVTSVVGQTGDITASQIKSGIQTSSGGFAIGNGASAGSGFAGGNGAVATDEGVAIGDGATAYGRAIQLGAGSVDGEDENDALKVFDKILMSYGYIHPEVYILNKLAQTTSGNGNNYIRRSDGLLIQWGRVSRTQQTQTINFPSSLKYGTVPTVFVTQNQGGTNNNCYPACIGTTTSTSFTVNTFNNNGAYINWLAIGWCFWTI